jgi:hypothetical protein
MNFLMNTELVVYIECMFDVYVEQKFKLNLLYEKSF